MARIRTVKPDIWESEQLGEVRPEARLLFIGLITQSDDHGRLKGSPKLVRSWVFPYDDYSLQNISEWLQELHEIGLIAWFTVKDRQFIELPTWHKHQRVSHPTDSVLPSHSEADSAGSPEDSGELQSVPEEPYRERKGKEGKGRDKEKALSTDKPPTESRQIFDAWVTSTGKNPNQVKFTTDRRRLINRQLKTYPFEDLIDAVRGWRHSPHHRGENDRGTVYNDLELLLKNAKNIEKFRDLERAAAPARPLVTVEASGEAVKAWENALTVLEQRLDPAGFRSWIEPLRVKGIAGNRVVLEAEGRIVSWVERRYLSVVLEAIDGFDGVELVACEAPALAAVA